MARTRLKSVQENWGSFALNIKSATNTVALSGVNGANNFASSLSITYTVETACVALVTVSIGTVSSSDFEFGPQIYVDGALANTFTPAASTGSASGRAVVRGFTYAINLSAGTHTISPGANYSSGTGLSTAISGCTIAAIVLGNVTA